jgi:hypothetical protein
VPASLTAGARAVQLVDLDHAGSVEADALRAALAASAPALVHEGGGGSLAH